MREQLVERARAEVALGHPGDGLDVAQPAGARLDVRFEVVGRVVGLAMPILLFGDLGFEIRLAPARRDRPTPPRASSANNCALPASRRASMSVVMTPTSAALSSAHSRDGAHAVTDLEIDVPQKGDHAFDHAATRVVGRGRHEDQDVDVGMRVQFAAAIAADGRERPAFIARGQLRAPDFAQDGVDEFGARVHQRLHRLVGAEAFGEFGVRIPEFGAKGVRRVAARWRAVRQDCEPQPGRAAQHRGFGSPRCPRRRTPSSWYEIRALAALAERQHFDAGLA